MLAFILSLLLLNPQIKEPQPKTDYNPNWIQSVFLFLELMDYRETRYVLCRWDEAVIDVSTMITRLQQHYNTGLICDANKFPSRDVANELLIFNRSYKQHLEACKAIYPGCNELDIAILENKRLYLVWDALRDAQCDYYYIHIRRMGLKNLKRELDKIDTSWYDLGIMPPNVPLWRFTTIK